MRSFFQNAGMMMEMCMCMFGMCMILRAKISDMFSVVKVRQAAE
ncbi:MAG: hypothetical protein ACI39H_03995 [Lachnospiraceae bacterium]